MTARWTSTDPRSAGRDEAVGSTIVFESAGSLTLLYHYDTGTTDWVAVPGPYRVVTVDPRTGGLAARPGSVVLYYSSGFSGPGDATLLYKYGDADTEWGTFGSEASSATLDMISATRGAVLYRGASGWAALSPGTSGHFLKTNGAGADPAWAAGGGGGSATITEVEVDFGSTPVADKQFTVVDAAVSPSSVVMLSVSGASPTGRDADEVQVDPIHVVATPSSGSFTVRARANFGRVLGKYKLLYLVG